MQGKIQVIDDAAMPDGHDFLLVAEEDAAFLFYRRSKLDERTLEDSWEAYRRLLGVEDEPRPPLRVAI